jgi:hypothetical protein
MTRRRRSVLFSHSGVKKSPLDLADLAQRYGLVRFDVD